MFYFSKRNITFIILIVIGIIILIFSINKNNIKNEIQMVSAPVRNKVIVIDAGHGLPDEGAESKNGISEASINLSITKKVQKLLEESGNTVILTRIDENGIYDNENATIKEKKTSDIKNRVRIGNNSSADIFVSIHLNKINEEQYWGWQTFYKDGNTESEKLAKCLQQGINQSIKKDNKRVPLKIENKYIIDNVKIPTSIVECGFLSNAEEEKLLQTEEYQNQLACGIYIGILDYFY